MKKNLIIILLLMITACTQPVPEGFEEYVERPVDELYNEAMEHMRNQNYKKAADAFDEVNEQHPFSIWAKRAQVMGAYAQYLRGRYNEAILSLESYIKLYPGSDDIDYAYYIIAISYFEQIGDIERDQSIALLSLQKLQEVMDRFPDSEYARDAAIKIDLANDQLAGKHMSVGRYYLKRNEYLAAIKRFRIVVEQFQTTSHIEEALLRLIEANLALGLQNEAKLIASVLGHNYPNSKWYADAFLKLEGKIPNYEQASFVPGFDILSTWMGGLIPKEF